MAQESSTISTSEANGHKNETKKHLKFVGFLRKKGENFPDFGFGQMAEFLSPIRPKRRTKKFAKIGRIFGRTEAEPNIRSITAKLKQSEGK